MAGRAKSSANIARRKTCKISRLEKSTFFTNFHCVDIFLCLYQKEQLSKSKRNIIASPPHSTKSTPKCSLFIKLISDRGHSFSHLDQTEHIMSWRFSHWKIDFMSWKLFYIEKLWNPYHNAELNGWPQKKWSQIVSYLCRIPFVLCYYWRWRTAVW